VGDGVPKGTPARINASSFVSGAALFFQLLFVFQAPELAARQALAMGFSPYAPIGPVSLRQIDDGGVGNYDQVGSPSPLPIAGSCYAVASSAFAMTTAVLT